MRHVTVFCCAVVLIGCRKSEAPPSGDTTAMAPAAPERPSALSLADVAGTWKLRTTDDVGGNAVESRLTATGDTSGWTLTRPNGTSVPVRVALQGDSLVLEPAPYESALRKGVQVRARIALRREGDKLVGTNEAHYHLARGDSVAKRPAEAVRAP